MVTGLSVRGNMDPKFDAATTLHSRRCFITTSKDMTARLYTLNPVEGFRPKTFAGHKSAVLSAYFSSDSKSVMCYPRFCDAFTD